jgi:hypothetical protein
MKLVHDKLKWIHNNLFKICLIIFILVSLSIIAFCTTSVLIEATQDNPVLIEEKDLPGKLSNYRKYTYDWFSKAMNVTSQIRGLDFTRNLYFFSTTTQELGELLVEYERSQTEEDIMEDFFKQIGFLSTEESFADLYGEDQEEDYSSIAGFYGIGTNTFVIVEDFQFDENPYRPLRFEDVVLVHELTHALQDMNFNLTRLINSYQDTTDSLMSMKALVEGDATLTQYLFYISEHRDFRNLDDEEKENLIRRISDRFSSFGYGGTIESDVPDYWLKEAVFVYLQGAGFVSQLYLAGGYELVNEAFSSKPPLSTEQILHPVKYIENDIPSMVDLPDISTQLNNTSEGLWSMEYEDTLGEFNIFVLIDKYLSDKGINYANRVSEGWDGDKVNFYINYNGEEDALVWVTAWDTEKDAIEFFDAYISLLVNKTNPDTLSINKYTKENIIWNKEGGFINSIYIKDNSVYIIEDIPEEIFEEVSQVILSSEIDFNLDE